MFDSVMAANRAAFAAFGVTGADDGPVSNASVAGTNGSSPSTDGEGAEDAVAAIQSIEARETKEEWDVEVTVHHRDRMGVGDQAIFTKTISEDDVRRFAVSSGDTNPLHLDDDFAGKTRFKGRIAHGTLVGGLISAALARLPGLTIYLSQDLEFHNPVRIGDRLTAQCEIVEDLGDNQYRLTTRVYDENEEDVIIDGEAVVLIDELPDADD
ncbi:MaoC family dehydratase [Haloarculaceae archaeon H-GB2-1]|nr:MaoC family dehydratase [Haloarculaceae archaeon H-GB1-1]MEA5406845.1 MaoC family dehydratase [Haloarculaceae archaeon H-GB2-1]